MKKSVAKVMQSMDFRLKFTGHSVEYENNLLYKLYAYVQILFYWILLLPIVSK